MSAQYPAVSKDAVDVLWSLTGRDSGEREDEDQSREKGAGLLPGISPGRHGDGVVIHGGGGGEEGGGRGVPAASLLPTAAIALTDWPLSRTDPGAAKSEMAG